MRKIEEKMLEAWDRRSYMNSGNTMVSTKDDVTNVFLHGNLIATKTKVEVEDMSTSDCDYLVTLYDGGYPSRTTASRLRALASYLPVQVNFSSIFDEIIFTSPKDDGVKKEQGKYQCKIVGR